MTDNDTNFPAATRLFQLSSHQNMDSLPHIPISVSTTRDFFKCLSLPSLTLRETQQTGTSSLSSPLLSRWLMCTGWEIEWISECMLLLTLSPTEGHKDTCVKSLQNGSVFPSKCKMLVSASFTVSMFELPLK